MLEEVVKVVVDSGKEVSKEMSKKSFFEDSNRVSDVPKLDEASFNHIDEKCYPDSDRFISDGPQWDEASFNDYEEQYLQGELKDTGIDKIGEFDESNEGANKEKKTECDTEIDEDKDINEKKGLTNEEKQELKEKMGWSDEIIDSIGSSKEAQIYIDNGVKELEIDGKKCLIKDDIDIKQVDEDGISNIERMERGRPPLSKDGQEIELHHIGQKADSPLAELTTREHRGVGNDIILHDKNIESVIDRNEFAKERKNHWQSRVAEGGI